MYGEWCRVCGSKKWSIAQLSAVQKGEMKKAILEILLQGLANITRSCKRASNIG